MRPDDIESGGEVRSLPDHVRTALENAEDDAARFHLREALQLLESDE